MSNNDSERPSERAMRLGMRKQKIDQAKTDVDDVSARIVKGGYRANLSDVENLRNHVRKLLALLNAE